MPVTRTATGSGCGVLPIGTPPFVDEVFRRRQREVPQRGAFANNSVCVPEEILDIFGEQTSFRQAQLYGFPHGVPWKHRWEFPKNITSPGAQP